jgi:DNA invertase Pin-like site-specific DNA recombinase
MEKLKFAPIVRVSTEKQEKKKESLLTQKKQMIEAVRLLKGEIPDYCWLYSGQEHATFEFERQKLDKLLFDSSKNLFDAVIVVDATRWSRDNRKNKEGLEILRQNNIRFFVGTIEYNLYSPEQTFFLSMAVEVGEFQAAQGAIKSITTRINKARRGEPATRLPIGRTWSEKEGWGVVPKIEKKFTTIAKRFLNGENLTKLGEIYGISRNSLREVLVKRCDDKWQQKFQSKRFNIDEVIETKVPALVDSIIIEAVKAKVQENKTIFHAQRKEHYLFGRMILCGHCGKALFGEMINGKVKNYRHRTETTRKGQKIRLECNQFQYIQADLIEEPIMAHIFTMFGDKARIERAIKDAIPNLDKIEELKLQLKQFKKEKVNSERKIEPLIDAIEDGIGDVESIKKRIIEHENRIKLLNHEIAIIKSRLEKIPSEELITLKADLLKKMIKGYYGHSLAHYKKMTFDDKRKLLQSIFSGVDAQGNRCGIYIKKDQKGWIYEIKGNFISEIGRLSNKIRIVNKP